MSSKTRICVIASAGLFLYAFTMNEAIERLIQCGYDPVEAATICLMLIKEGGDKNLFAYVREAEYVAVFQQ